MGIRTIYIGNADVLTNKDVKYLSGVYRFTVTFQSSEAVSSSHYGVLLEIGKIKIGNDNDDEFELEANEFSLKFFLSGNTQSEYFDILTDMKNHVPTITVTRNGSDFFKGFIKNDNIEGNADRIFSIHITDGLEMTKEVNLSDTPNPLGYDFSTPETTKKKVTDFFIEAINEITDTGYLSVETNCDLRFNITGHGSPPIGDVYFYPYWLFNQATPEGYPGYPQPAKKDTLADVIKAVADQFGCFVYTGFDKKIYLIQRALGSNPITMVNGENILGKPKIQITPRYDALHLFVFCGYTPATPKFGDIIYGTMKADSNKYKNKVKNLYSYNPVINEIWWGNHLSLIDEEGYSGLLYYDSLNYFAVDKNGVHHYYGSNDSLTNIVGQDTFSLISKNRLVIEGEFNGSIDSYSMLEFYTLEGYNGKVFRPQKIEYDLHKNTSKIRFIEV